MLDRRVALPPGVLLSMLRGRWSFLTWFLATSVGAFVVAVLYPVARYLRDALVYTVGEGTSEIQRNIIARAMGHGAGR